MKPQLLPPHPPKLTALPSSQTTRRADYVRSGRKRASQYTNSLHQNDKKFVVYKRKTTFVLLVRKRDSIYRLTKKEKRKEHVFVCCRAQLKVAVKSSGEISRSSRVRRCCLLSFLLYKHFVRDVFSSDCNTHLARITCRALLIECGKERKKDGRLKWFGDSSFVKR